MRSYSCTAATLVFAAIAGSVLAQENKADPARSAPAFTFGGDVRLRYEAYDGVHTLGSDVPYHHRDYFRLRARAWANYVASPELSAFVRVAAEPRYWFNNSSAAGAGREWKYGLVDNVHARWTGGRKGATPLTLVAGRQDIQLGDQWLVSDGTPGDGSWTNYYDGLRATLDATGIKTKFDAIVFKQQASAKDHLPVVGKQTACFVMEQDELGVVLYATNKTLKNLQLEGYAIYKEDRRVTAAGNNGAAYTAGARVAGTPSPKWQYSVEAARQWGRRDLLVRYPTTVSHKREIQAYGANARLTCSFKDKLANQVTLLGEWLSGDDPKTANKDEMFDVLWGRYPRLGETWNVTYAVETGGRSGQFQNLLKYGVQWAIAPTKTTSISTMYCALFAPQEVPTRSTNNARFSREGNFRGHQAQVIVRKKITKELSALLFAEAAFLGDFYTQRDTVTFYRAEVMYTF